PPPLGVPQQPGRELPSADQDPGTGDETLRLAWAGAMVSVCVRQHQTALSAPSSSDQRVPMAARDNRIPKCWDQLLTAHTAPWCRQAGLPSVMGEAVLDGTSSDHAPEQIALHIHGT